MDSRPPPPCGGPFLVVLVTLFPFYWMVSSSFKTQTDLLATPPVWLFTPTLANYARSFRR